MELWYPVDYADSEPWFEVRGTVVYTTQWHPAGRSPNPWLQIRNGAAYPVLDHPMAGAVRPWYDVEPRRAVQTQANPDPMQFIVVIVAEQSFEMATTGDDRRA
jgi:hypothetical protein